MAAILNSNMADTKGEFRVAQYLKMFVIYQCTFVPNLMLVSQNAQSYRNFELNRPTIRQITSVSFGVSGSSVSVSVSVSDLTVSVSVSVSADSENNCLCLGLGLGLVCHCLGLGLCLG